MKRMSKQLGGTLIGFLAGLLTGLGGLLAAMDGRYRVKVKSRVREVLGMSGATA